MNGATPAAWKSLDEKYQLHPDMDATTFYKTISARGKEVMWAKKAQGEIMHKAPLGYKNARDEHGRSILVIDPVTYPLVQRAKELHAQGWSVSRIQLYLQRDHNMLVPRMTLYRAVRSHTLQA